MNTFIIGSNGARFKQQGGYKMAPQRMMTTWNLRDDEARHQVNGLTLEEALLVIRGIAPSRISFWAAQSSSNGQWQRLWAFPELGIVLPPPLNQSNQPVSRPPTSVRPIELKTGESDGTLEIDVKGLNDRRTHRRFQKNFDFIVQIKNREFRAKTVNLSMDSLLLDQDVPGWARDPISAVLVRQDERVRVVCERADAGTSRSFILIEVDPVEVLREWLLRW